MFKKILSLEPFHDIIWLAFLSVYVKAPGIQLVLEKCFLNLGQPSFSKHSLSGCLQFLTIYLGCSFSQSDFFMHRPSAQVSTGILSPRSPTVSQTLKTKTKPPQPLFSPAFLLHLTSVKCPMCNKQHQWPVIRTPFYFCLSW